jgi:hypothetical protein
MSCCLLDKIEFGFDIVGAIAILGGVIVYICWKQEVKKRAKYGFYPQLISYIVILESKICEEKGQGESKPIYSFWYNFIQGDALGDILQGQYLAELSKEFLHFFHTTQDQIPPCTCKRKKWKKAIECLQSYLVYFASYNGNVIEKTDNADEKIRAKCKEIKGAMAEIKKQLK